MVEWTMLIRITERTKIVRQIYRIGSTRTEKLSACWTFFPTYKRWYINIILQLAFYVCKGLLHVSDAIGRRKQKYFFGARYREIPCGGRVCSRSNKQKQACPIHPFMHIVCIVAYWPGTHMHCLNLAFFFPYRPPLQSPWGNLDACCRVR